MQAATAKTAASAAALAITMQPANANVKDGQAASFAVACCARTHGPCLRAQPLAFHLHEAQLVRFAAAAVQAAMRNDRTHQVLEALAAEIGEHCQIGFRSGNEVVYADTVRAVRSSGLHFEQGRRAPLYCSSTGKLFLAELTSPELEGWLRDVARPATTQRTIVSARALRLVLKGPRLRRPRRGRARTHRRPRHTRSRPSSNPLNDGIQLDHFYIFERKLVMSASRRLHASHPVSRVGGGCNGG